MRGSPKSQNIQRDGPILGWRVWRFDEKGRLFSLLMLPRNSHCKCCGEYNEAEEMCSWPAGAPLVAHSPALNDASGIHAMKKDWDAELSNYCSSAYTGAGVENCVGVVALWGVVHEHEDGYRAQYGYPVKLYFLKQHEAGAAAAGARYRVPVELIDSFPFGNKTEARLRDEREGRRLRQIREEKREALNKKRRSEIALLRATEPQLPEVKGQTRKRVEALLFLGANPGGIRTSRLTKETNIIRQAHLLRAISGTTHRSTPAGEVLLNLERLGLVSRKMQRDWLNLWTLTEAGRNLLELVRRKQEEGR